MPISGQANIKLQVGILRSFIRKGKWLGWNCKPYEIRKWTWEEERDEESVSRSTIHLSEFKKKFFWTQSSDVVPGNCWSQSLSLGVRPLTSPTTTETILAFSFHILFTFSFRTFYHHQYLLVLTYCYDLWLSGQELPVHLDLEVIQHLRPVTNAYIFIYDKLNYSIDIIN